MFDRITGYGSRTYGMAAIALGLLVMFVGLSATSSEIITYGILIFALGVGVVYLTLDRWYCQMCGQAQGYLLKPNSCDRCDSNRMAKQDPGVGDAVRVKR